MVKYYIKYVLILMAVAFLYGFVVPYCISYNEDILVMIGFVQAILIYPVVLYFLVKKDVIKIINNLKEIV